ncbi:hypothetical protein CAURIS_09350 [Corynebacterium auris]|nr:hypothetical protein CAURIS_09350 [Corynebacterium auris]
MQELRLAIFLAMVLVVLVVVGAWRGSAPAQSASLGLSVMLFLLIGVAYVLPETAASATLMGIASAVFVFTVLVGMSRGFERGSCK